MTNKITDYYLADYVQRWHNKPYVPPQTTGQHVAGMLALCRVLHPNPSVELLLAIIDHDKHEYTFGDIPYSAKRKYPEIKAIESNEQRDFYEAMDLEMPVLSEMDIAWLKYLDQLEARSYVSAFCDTNNAHVEKLFRELHFVCLDLEQNLKDLGEVFA